MQDEKRRQARISYKAEIRVEVNGDKLSGTCKNLSMSGMLLVLDRTLAVGSQGRLEISQEIEGERLEIGSGFEVMRINDLMKNGGICEIGLHFNDLDFDSSVKLYNLIRYRSQSET